MPQPNPRVFHQGLQWRRGSEFIADTQISSYEFKDVDPAPYNAETFHRSYESTNTPGFRRNGATGRPSKKVSKTLPENPHVVFRRTMENERTYTRYAEILANNYRAHNSGPPWAVGNYFCSQLTEWATLQEQARRKAAIRLMRKVNDPKFNAGTAWAERKQTGDLLSGAVDRIGRAAKNMRRGNLKGFADALGVLPTDPRLSSWDKKVSARHVDKRLANGWLEYQFGWLPLLKDVYGAAELLASHAAEEFYRVEAAASASVTEHIAWKPQPNSLQHTVDYFIKTTCRYKVKYHLDNYALAAMSQTGISNPALVAWNLLPYSFVVDWFLPVSSYLERLQAFQGFEIEKGTISIRQLGITNVQLGATQTGMEGGFPTLVNVTGGYTRKEFLYSRSGFTVWPNTGWEPSFRDPFERDPAWTIGTSLALLRQVFQ